MLSESEEQKIIPELTKFLKWADGIAFCLVMRNKSGELRLRPRMNQPCWGELRKYKSTHGEEATKEEHRPSDLRHPFPKGIPEALAIHVGIENSLTEFLWSDESPWVRGFGSTKNYIKVKRGVILKDTNIDPTVLVNLLKNSGDYRQSNLFDILTARGLTPLEAVFPCIFTGIWQEYIYTKIIPSPDTYTNAMTIDVDRVLTQNPHDLTGGTLRDRFDYERKDLHKLFHNPKGVNFTAELAKYNTIRPCGSIYKVDYDIAAKATKEILEKYKGK